MRALTVVQPAANQIASGRKIYIRSWKRIFYRGPVLITSAARINGCPSPIEPAGCAVALVDIIDCRPMRPSDAVPACEPYAPGSVVWHLRLKKRLEPVRVVGYPHLWCPDLKRYPELEAQLQ